MVMYCGLCGPSVSRCRGPTSWDMSSRQQHKHHTLLLSFTTLFGSQLHSTIDVCTEQNKEQVGLTCKGMYLMSTHLISISIVNEILSCQNHINDLLILKMVHKELCGLLVELPLLHGVLPLLPQHLLPEVHPLRRQLLLHLGLGLDLHVVLKMI